MPVIRIIILIVENSQLPRSPQVAHDSCFELLVKFMCHYMLQIRSPAHLAGGDMRDCVITSLRPQIRDRG